MNFLSAVNCQTVMDKLKKKCILKILTSNGEHKLLFLWLYILMNSFQHYFCSIIFGVFFILNLLVWVNGSSAAVPFSTLVALLALWFFISVPLTFVGAYFGYKKRVSEQHPYPIEFEIMRYAHMINVIACICGNSKVLLWFMYFSIKHQIFNI